MRVYKLTDKDCATGKEYNPMTWGPDVTHEVEGKGELCSSGWIHAYSHPLIAIFMNPIHGDFKEPRLWECEAEGNTQDNNGSKLGVQKLTTIQEIPLPAATQEHRIRFGILCVKKVCAEPSWVAWANGWLSGKDRAAAAAAAAWAAAAAASAANIDLIAIAEEAVKEVKP